MIFIRQRKRRKKENSFSFSLRNIHELKKENSMGEGGKLCQGQLCVFTMKLVWVKTPKVYRVFPSRRRRRQSVMVKRKTICYCIHMLEIIQIEIKESWKDVIWINNGT